MEKTPSLFVHMYIYSCSYVCLQVPSVRQALKCKLKSLASCGAFLSPQIGPSSEVCLCVLDEGKGEEVGEGMLRTPIIVLLVGRLAAALTSLYWWHNL